MKQMNLCLLRKLLDTGTRAHLIHAIVYCNTTGLKRPLHIFSVWISCLMKDPGRAEPPEYRSPDTVGICWISYSHAGHLHNLCVQGQCYVKMMRLH